MGWTYTKHIMKEKEPPPKPSTSKKASKPASPSARSTSTKIPNPIKPPTAAITRPVPQPIKQINIIQSNFNPNTPTQITPSEESVKRPNPASIASIRAPTRKPSSPNATPSGSTRSDDDPVIEISDDSSDESPAKAKPSSKKKASSSKKTTEPGNTPKLPTKNTKAASTSKSLANVSTESSHKESKAIETSNTTATKTKKKASQSISATEGPDKKEPKKDNKPSKKKSKQADTSPTDADSTENKTEQTDASTSKKPTTTKKKKSLSDKGSTEKKTKKQNTPSTATEKKNEPSETTTSSQSDSKPTRKPTKESAKTVGETPKKTTLKRTRQADEPTDDADKETAPKKTRQAAKSSANTDKAPTTKKSAKEPPQRSSRSITAKANDEATEALKNRNRKRAIPEDASDSPVKMRRVNKPLFILDDAYKLNAVLKGHTESNTPVRMEDEFEDSKDLWCCDFEPDSDVVAICGSYTVLFLDTKQGLYAKKYTHTENQEIFYCMSWTTLREEVPEDEQSESCHILAVAGRLGSIKLLNPLQNECYRYLFGHQKAVLALAFCKSTPQWLFSASADNTIRLWDIGSPTSEMDDSICLAHFVLPTDVGSPSALSVSYDGTKLFVGCNSGDLVRFDIPPANLKKLKATVEKHRENGSSRANAYVWTVKNGFVYPQGNEWHEGYVDDICILGQDGNRDSPMFDQIVSRGSDDMEIIIWDPVKSKKTDASIDKSLEWPDSANCTGLKFKVVESDDQKVLLAGDYDGQIRIFNIGDGVKSNVLKDKSLEQLPATRILSHQMSEDLIRDVCCSSDTRTIVAVDNNNTVFIWTASTI